MSKGVFMADPKEYEEIKPQRQKKKFTRDLAFEKLFMRANLFTFVANFEKSKNILLRLTRKFPDKTEAFQTCGYCFFRRVS